MGASRGVGMGRTMERSQRRVPVIWGFLLSFAALSPAAGQKADSALVPDTPRPASFDCRRAQTVVERTICASAELASLDGHVGEAYRRAQRALAGDARSRLVSEQRAWVAQRERECGSPTLRPSDREACIRSTLEQRWLALDEIANPRLQAAGVDATRLRFAIVVGMFHPRDWSIHNDSQLRVFDDVLRCEQETVDVRRRITDGILKESFEGYPGGLAPARQREVIAVRAKIDARLAVLCRPHQAHLPVVAEEDFASFLGMMGRFILSAP